jgi:hypothetical protein
MLIFHRRRERRDYERISNPRGGKRFEEVRRHVKQAVTYCMKLHSQLLKKRTRSAATYNERFCTKNIFFALRHLRHSDRPRFLWIDVICINQGDIPERNEHVIIYTGSAGVPWAATDNSVVLRWVLSLHCALSTEALLCQPWIGSVALATVLKI